MASGTRAQIYQKPVPSIGLQGVYVDVCGPKTGQLSPSLKHQTELKLKS